jgi:hypothetical protein
MRCYNLFVAQNDRSMYILDFHTSYIYIYIYIHLSCHPIKQNQTENEQQTSALACHY